MMKYGFLLCLILFSCSQPSSYPTKIIKRPIGSAITCKNESGDIVPISDCSGLGKYPIIWVGDADLGRVMVLDAASGKYKDFDRFVPGYNGIFVGYDMIDLKAQPSGQYVYVLSTNTITVISTTSFEKTDVKLPCDATSFDLIQVGSLAGSLVVSCINPSGVMFVSGKKMDEFSVPIPMVEKIRYVTASPDGKFIYFIPQSGRFLARMQLDTNEIEKVGILEECQDGIDNDNDGLTDRFDPSCLYPMDREDDEDKRPCENVTSVNGLTIGGYGVCEMYGVALNPLFACMNGKDDDGDGLTDFDQDEDCYGYAYDREDGSPTRVSGRPAISPNGKFIYVPLSDPPGIAVFSKEPFVRINVNDKNGPRPNMLLERLGFKDIWINNPVMEIKIAEVSQKVYAFVALSSGQVVRVLVEDGGEARHQIDLASIQMKSSALGMSLEVNGVTVDRSIEAHPEYPSLGPMTVSLVPGSDGYYSYYGVVFNGDPSLELTENWKVTFEGVIPGTESKSGFFASKDIFEDPFMNFCNLGVEAGDNLVITIEEDSKCINLGKGEVEYGIVKVEKNRLYLKEFGNGYAQLPGSDCPSGPYRYRVRVKGAWTVVGSKSGFLHNYTSNGNDCVLRDDRDERFTGRAYTSMPKNGKELVSCPPLTGAEEIDWKVFKNPAFSFRIYPGCKIDENFKVSIVPELRDTEISFKTISGQSPKVISTGGLPGCMNIVGRTLFLSDMANGTGFLISMDDLEILKIYY